MSLRETMNKNPLATGIVLLVLVIAGGWFAYSMLTDRGGQIDRPTHYWFSVDEGKTTFSVSADEAPPIMHDGKEAVRVRMYSCDGGKTTFVGYLEKYTDDFKKKVDAENAKPKQTKATGVGGAGLGLLGGPAEAFSHLVKKPGDTTWQPLTSAKGSAVVGVLCPSGKIEDLTEKLP